MDPSTGGPVSATGIRIHGSDGLAIAICDFRVYSTYAHPISVGDIIGENAHNTLSGVVGLPAGATGDISKVLKPYYYG